MLSLVTALTLAFILPRTTAAPPSTGVCLVWRDSGGDPTWSFCDSSASSLKLRVDGVESDLGSAPAETDSEAMKKIFAPGGKRTIGVSIANRSTCTYDTWGANGTTTGSCTTEMTHCRWAHKHFTSASAASQSGFIDSFEYVTIAHMASPVCTMIKSDSSIADTRFWFIMSNNQPTLGLLQDDSGTIASHYAGVFYSYNGSTTNWRAVSADGANYSNIDVTGAGAPAVDTWYQICLDLTTVAASSNFTVTIQSVSGCGPSATYGTLHTYTKTGNMPSTSTAMGHQVRVQTGVASSKNMWMSGGVEMDIWK